jgi:hypothetical protein
MNRKAVLHVMRMSQDNYSESRGKVTTRSFIPPISVAVLSIVIVLYLRLGPNWSGSFSGGTLAMALPVCLMWIFYASTLITITDYREMQGTISGWFDVTSLMVAEGILAYLIFADILYVAVVVVLCALFVAYVDIAQRS